MKTYLLFMALFLGGASWSLAQKNCANDSTGLIPLIDLAGKSWRGYSGGLYPGGMNTRTQAHKNKALQQAQKIQPLDATGAASPAGKIVWIGVGASNPRTEFLRFSEQLDTLSRRNPALRLVNTCIGGQGIQKMNSPDDNYWKQAEKMLQDSSLTTKQVQIAWIETDNTQTADTSFPRAPQQLGEEFKTLLATMKQLYPNLKICYLTARGYSGYVDPASATAGKGLLFPRDYLNGWAIKWLIEKQINNETGYGFEGAAAPLPFITWGSYHWADGSVKRSDGLQWLCNTDIGPDGLHLTEAGEKKSGALMFEYFTNDESAKPWILGNGATSVEDRMLYAVADIAIFPNPARVVCYLANAGNSSRGYRLLDLSGKEVAAGVTTGEIPVGQLPQGLYWAILEDGSRTLVVVIQ